MLLSIKLNIDQKNIAFRFVVSDINTTNKFKHNVDRKRKLNEVNINYLLDLF